MKKNVLIGFDPGHDGCMCIVDVLDDGTSSVTWTDIYTEAFGDFVAVDFEKLQHEVAPYMARIASVRVELLGYIGITKGKGLFEMGRCYGQLTQCVEMLFHDIVDVIYTAPKHWKRDAGLTGLKKDSVDLVKALLNQPEMRLRHDEAEAFLIAIDYKSGEKITDSFKRLLMP